MLRCGARLPLFDVIYIYACVTVWHSLVKSIMESSVNVLPAKRKRTTVGGWLGGGERAIDIVFTYFLCSLWDSDFVENI